MTLTIIAACAVIVILAVFGLVLYANSAGKAKAAVAQNDAEEQGRKKIDEIVNYNNSFSSEQLDKRLHDKTNQNS